MRALVLRLSAFVFSLASCIIASPVGADSPAEVVHVRTFELDGWRFGCMGGRTDIGRCTARKSNGTKQLELEADWLEQKLSAHSFPVCPENFTVAATDIVSTDDPLAEIDSFGFAMTVAQETNALVSPCNFDSKSSDPEFEVVDIAFAVNFLLKLETGGKAMFCANDPKFCPETLKSSDAPN